MAPPLDYIVPFPFLISAPAVTSAVVHLVASAVASHVLVVASLPSADVLVVASPPSSVVPLVASPPASLVPLVAAFGQLLLQSVR